MRIRDLLVRQRNNNVIALKCVYKAISFNEWHTMSKDMSETLHEYCKDSLCVGVFLPNSLEYAISYFAVMFLNKILIPIGVQSKELEINSTVNYHEIDLVITNSEYLNFLINSLQLTDYKKYIYNCTTNELVCIHNQLEFINKTNDLIPQWTDDDVAIMLHTSGTPSNPKRVY